MPRLPALEQRFTANLQTLGLAGSGAHVLVALSGGADSTVLLHLLRFAARGAGVRVSAAHFDHAMRPESAADARWVAGLCAAWEVPLAVARAGRAPRGEEEARDLRYAFLRTAREQAGATHLATAHHADDQAETVLFRLLRGTGTAGLAGIAPLDAGGVVRPLLPFWRAELRRYARARRLRWREDPTNRLPGAARNRIRLELLPLLERDVAPGARRSLVRLAELAREDEAAWERVLADASGGLAREEEGALVLVRGELAGYDSAVAARLLRGLLRRYGLVLDRTGTRAALRFICTAPSGRQLLLPGGIRVSTEFGAARIERTGEPAPADEPLVIRGEAGSGVCRIGGRERRVEWRTGAWDGGEAPALPPERVKMPLLLRGWRPGDRMRTPAGTKPLKKLFNETRIPRSARARVPVLADAEGAVLWAAGLGQGMAPPRPGERGLTLDVRDA
ncbi:MAG TPA: tRNA lysidine(34) synthetase TilS [Longimicrobiaceae bacterium]|nr:tRNA lysidine(34) synthetase TilS [Longimicrobiaceae bacterium]